MKCKVCQRFMSVAERACYRSVCEDCFAAGASGDTRSFLTHTNYAQECREAIQARYLPFTDEEPAHPDAL